jgi:hypothetical protein
VRAIGGRGVVIVYSHEYYTLGEMEK